MRRAIVALVLATAVALGLSSCGGSPDPAPVSETVTSTPMETSTPLETSVAVETPTGAETPTEAEIATVEAEATDDAPPAVDLSMMNDCMSLMEPLQEANLALVKIAESATNDPQSAVDMWRALSQAFEDFGNTAANIEVAELSAAVGETGHALTDVLQKIYVDQDLSAASEFNTANDAFFAAYQELLELCNTA